MAVIQIGDLYALGGAATFAISSSMIKRLNVFGTTLQLNFLRSLVGAIIFLIHLVIIVKVASLFSIPWIILIYLSLSVIFNVVLGDSSFFEAQNKLGVKIANPLANTFPFFTIAFAVLFLGETVTTNFLIGSVILIPGIIMLSLDKIEDETSFLEEQQKKHEEDRKTRIEGLILILFAIICYTAGIIFTTIATKNLDPIVANSIRMPVATIGLFVLASYEMRTPKMRSEKKDWAHLVTSVKKASVTEKSIIITAGIFGTYLSSLFLVLSVQAIGASRSAILFSTGPFFALPLAIIWLRERIGWKTLIGTLLTVIGLWIIL